jgi:hypothetical protein
VGRKKSLEDSEDTITFITGPPARGARVLCLCAGGALVLQHLLMGVVLSPFLGSDAFVWGNVLGSLVVSLGLGMLAGEVLGRLFGGNPRAGYRILALAGLLVALGAWASPIVARFALDMDPDSPWAPAMALGALTVLPGVLLAAVLPGMVEASVRDETGSAQKLARSAMKRFSLAMLGGIVGLAIASWSLRHADDAKLWAQLYALGALLVGLALVGLGGPGRGLAITAAVGVGTLISLSPSEIQYPRFQAALTEAFEMRGAGRYYAETCPDHVLTGTELARRLKAASKRLDQRDRKIAVLLVVETLKTLGPLNLSGSGLKNLLDIYLPQESKPLILPFVDKIASVQSDGKKIHMKITRSNEDGHAHFSIPGKDDEWQEFEILDDFDLILTYPDEHTTKLEIGPQVIHPAGFFEWNDTITTPFKCKNVSLFVDASLLALTVENGTDQVILSAVGQAKIGKIRTKALQVIDKSLVK